MDVTRAGRSPFHAHDPSSRAGHARRLERSGPDVSAPTRRREPAEPQRTEPARTAREEPAQRSRRQRANGLLEGLRAAHRGAGEASRGPARRDATNAEARALFDRFLDARESIGTRLENALEGVTNPDDIAFLEQRAARAEERLFTRFANALGGSLQPNEPAAPASASVARTAVLEPGSANVASTRVGGGAPPVGGEVPASDETVDPEVALVDRLVQANEAIDRRLANALEGVSNPADLEFLRERATAARERVTTRFLNALGGERGLAPNAASADVDRQLVDAFLQAHESFAQRAQNALAHASEPGRGAIEERLDAAQTRITERLLGALGAAPPAPEPPVAVADPEPVEPARDRATPLATDPTEAPADETTAPADPRRVLAERIRAAFEGLRERATRALEGAETRRERGALVERLAHAREALVARLHHGPSSDEAS